MSTAKSQQSTGQSDGSDDLIAELARMMATDAQPSSAAPAVAPESKVEPQESKPAAVRIPGPPENAPGAEKFDFDFGAPPKAAEALRPAPLVNWQDRLNKPAESVRREPVIEARVEPAAPVTREPEVPRVEPAPVAATSFIAPAIKTEVEAPTEPSRTPEPTRVAEPVREPEPIRTPEPVAPKAEPVAFTTHDFDFGFGKAAISEPLTTQPPPVQPATDSHDAIADLIAAELSDAEDAPAGTEPTEPVVNAQPTHAQTPAAREVPPTKPFLRAVNFAVQPKPEGDRFAVSPVFGVGSNARPAAPAAPEPKPAPMEQRTPLDPMDEIESLIGSSIRHDIGSKIEPKGPSSPIPVAREPSPMPRATTRPIQDDHGAAEAAILAAAAASGAELGRVQQPRAEERARPAQARASEKPRRERSEPRAGRFRPFIGPAVAAVLLVVAGGGLYWVLGNNNGGSEGAAPVLTADTTPVKEPPPAAPATADSPSASVVLNELSGGNTQATPEQLVSRDQTGDTASVAAIAPTETTGEEGLANRKVRTVTVRPDGTIVNADDALAGAQQLPVARPNVPAVPSGTLDNSDLLTAAAPEPMAAASPLTAAPVTSQPSTLTPTPGAAAPADQTAVSVDPANVTPPGVVAPVPRPRLTNRPTAALGPQPTNPVNAVVASNDPIGALAAAATQEQTPAPAPVATQSPMAAAYVQLSSQRDEGVARQSLVDISQRYGRMLNGVLPEVQRVDLGAKGIYYRVRVPTDSLRSANDLCGQIKSASGDCIVTTN